MPFQLQIHSGPKINSNATNPCHVLVREKSSKFDNKMDSNKKDKDTAPYKRNFFIFSPIPFSICTPSANHLSEVNVDLKSAT